MIDNERNLYSDVESVSCQGTMSVLRLFHRACMRACLRVCTKMTEKF